MRRAILIFLMLSLTGCSTWRTVSREQLASTVMKREPSRIRLTLTDSVLAVSHPTLRGDTLFGYERTRSGRRAIVVPMSAVESGAVRQANRKEATLVALSMLVVSLMVVLGDRAPRGWP
jgi:hypothetical protein